MAAWIRVGICCSSDLTLNAFAGPDQPESGKGDLEVVSIERSITIVFDSRRSSVRSHSSYLSGGHELSGRSSPLLTLFWLGNGMALDALRDSGTLVHEPGSNFKRLQWPPFAGLHRFNEHERTVLVSANFRYLPTLRENNLSSSHKSEAVCLAFGTGDQSNRIQTPALRPPSAHAPKPVWGLSYDGVDSIQMLSMGEVQPKQSSSLLIPRPNSQKSASLKQGRKHKGCSASLR
jgi:hypothetical protein